MIKKFLAAATLSCLLSGSALAGWETSEKGIDAMTDEATRTMGQVVGDRAKVALKCWADKENTWNLVVITSDDHPTGVELGHTPVEVRVGSLTKTVYMSRNNYRGAILLQGTFSSDILAALTSQTDASGKMALARGNQMYRLDMRGFQSSMSRMIETCGKPNL